MSKPSEQLSKLVDESCDAREYPSGGFVVEADKIDPIIGATRNTEKLLGDLRDQNRELWRELDSLTVGLHWCDDWDGMLIHAGSSEWDGCTCDIKKEFQ